MYLCGGDNDICIDVFVDEEGEFGDVYFVLVGEEDGGYGVEEISSVNDEDGVNV